MTKQYSRAQVAANGSSEEQPLLIIRNKVYNVASWLGDHPGGKEILLMHAGKDATRDYEEIGHSDFAIEKRETYLVGELVPEDRSSYADIPTKAQREVKRSSKGSSGATSLVVQSAAALLVALYVKQASEARAIPKVTYSALLRHAHLLMTLGAYGSIATSSIAMSYQGGSTKKAIMELHKGLGVLLGVGIFGRIYARYNSTIPPRFQSSIEGAESLSHYVAYLLLLYLPYSGLKHVYFSGGGAPLPFLGSGALPGKSKPTDEDFKKAATELEWHKFLGRFFKYGFLPFHVGIALYHASNNKDIVKKIAPFI